MTDKVLILNRTNRIITLRGSLPKTGKKFASTLEPGINYVPSAFMGIYKRNKIVVSYFDTGLLEQAASATLDVVDDTPKPTAEELEQQRVLAEIAAGNASEGGEG